jgi:hypothetical protein
MPYRISKQNILNRLPLNERGTAEEVGQRLLDLAGNICYLCGGNLLPASEILFADHVKAEGEGGATTLSNLRLVHLGCNSAKKDKNPEDVIPYLRLKRFIRENGGQLRYGEITKHFEIKPGKTQIEDRGSDIHLEFSDGTSVDAPVMLDFAGVDGIRYAFVQVPREAIFNDDDVQPRSVRVEHANAIFIDLAHNPLHEPPSCRTEPNDKGSLKRLRMFDGQHKTIASWMRKRDKVTIKLYLDMTAKKANDLVIAIQSRVKKLSLTPFESAAKMSEEWKARIGEYVEEMKQQNKEVTEAGYIAWLPPGPPRNNGKAALKNALLQQVLDEDDFKLASLVESPGISAVKTGLSESMLKTRFLEKLLVITPSDDSIEKSDADRMEAVENIVWMSNLFLDALLDDGGGDVDEQMISRKRERFFNQNTLEQVAELLRTIFVRETKIEDNAYLSVDLSEATRSGIEQKINTLASHPWWTAEWDRDDAMKLLRQANLKNQDRRKAFTGVAFDVGYALMGELYPAFDNRWIRSADGD